MKTLFFLPIVLISSIAYGQGCDAKNNTGFDKLGDLPPLPVYELMNPSKPSDVEKSIRRQIREIYPPTPQLERYQYELQLRHYLLLQSRLNAPQRRQNWQYKWQYQFNYPFGLPHWRYQITPQYHYQVVPQYRYRQDYRYDYRY